MASFSSDFGKTRPFGGNVTVRFYDDSSALANLLDEIDKKVMVQLRDGKTIFGHLRSVDEFTNIVLINAVERIYAGNNFGDIPLQGVTLIRGDNLAMVGEIDEAKEQLCKLVKLPFQKILALQKQSLEAHKDQEQRRFESFKKRGLHYRSEEERLRDDQFM